MARYVDAEKLVFEPDEQGGTNGVLILDRRNGKTMRLVLAALKQMVDGLPTEDVAPVVHGRWIEKVDMVSSYLSGCEELFAECSVCHAAEVMGSNYCPNCGAKMDLEVSDGKA